MANELIALRDLDLDIRFEDAEAPSAPPEGPGAPLVGDDGPGRSSIMAAQAPPSTPAPGGRCPTVTAPEPAAPFRVVTLRTGLFPAKAGIPGSSPRLKRCIDRLGQVETDVVALQEVWDADAADAIVAALRARYPYAARARRPAKGWGTGLIVLSRYPFAALHDVALPKSGGWRERSAQGLIAADIERDGERFRIINVQAGPAAPGRRGWRRNRAGPVRGAAAVRRIEALSGDCPVMLVGNLALGQKRSVASMLCRRRWRLVAAPAVVPAGTAGQVVPPPNPILFHDGGSRAAARPVAQPLRKPPRPAAAHPVPAGKAA